MGGRVTFISREDWIAEVEGFVKALQDGIVAAKQDDKQTWDKVSCFQLVCRGVLKSCVMHTARSRLPEHQSNIGRWYYCGGYSLS